MRSLINLKSLTKTILCLSVLAASQTAFSEVVNRMRHDGFCLTLEAGQDFYPLYGRASLKPEVYPIDNDFKQITISLNGLSPDSMAMIAARGATGDSSQWPIVFHGPMRLCQIVNFTLYTNKPNQRADRIEVGPNVALRGIQAISVESSQLKQMEVESRCVPNQDYAFDAKVPCVRLTSDRRSTQDSMLYIRHLGRQTCVIQNKNLTDIESRVEPNERTPMSCDDADLNSSPLEADQSPSGPIIIDRGPRGGGVVTRTTEDCGPYVRPVRLITVDPNYGLSHDEPAAPKKPSYRGMHTPNNK